MQRHQPQQKKHSTEQLGFDVIHSLANIPKVYHSSKSDEWSTSQDFYDRVRKEFEFDLDVAASVENTKCKRFFSKFQDALLQDWGTSICWCNPPYSQAGKFVEKAFEASQKGATVVCLLAARTDTRFFHQYALKNEVRFIRGRLRFGNSKNTAPFASILVIFRPRHFEIKSMSARDEETP